jgi:hypothetical protein
MATDEAQAYGGTEGKGHSCFGGRSTREGGMACGVLAVRPGIISVPLVEQGECGQMGELQDVLIDVR